MQLISLPHYLPRLRNLSLQSNQIRQWKDVDVIAGKVRKLAQLRELIFLDNPLRDNELRINGVEKYRRLAKGSSGYMDLSIDNESTVK